MESDEETNESNINDPECRGIIWNKKSLIETNRFQSKAYFESILNKQFDDDFFMHNIKILYPIFKHKLELEQKNIAISNELEVEHTLIHEIYALSIENKYADKYIDDFYYVPVKIDYFMFNRKFNTFKITSNHLCDHNLVHSSHQFISTVLRTLNKMEYTTKLSLISNSNNKLIPCCLSCCMECAELITIPIIDCCYALYEHSNSKNKNFNYNIRGRWSPAPFNIDVLCVVCIWLANILQHKYIKVALEKNADLMPTIFRTLFFLMKTAHFLYHDKLKLYKDRRDRIYFAIWRLLKEIIMNHCYIKKYYQKKDISKDRYCEEYIVEMLYWLMEEIEILGHIMKGRNNLKGVLNSLGYDYFGGIIILMSLLSYKETKNDVRGITHKGVYYENYNQCLTDLWMAVHMFSHDMSGLSNFFKESIVNANKLRRRNQIKCQWRKCKKWRVSDKFYKCKGCQAVTYCSKSCQKKAWKHGFHALVCDQYR